MGAVSESLGKYELEKIIESMGDAYSKSVDLNRETLFKKSRFMKCAGGFAFAQTLLLSIMAYISL